MSCLSSFPDPPPVSAADKRKATEKDAAANGTTATFALANLSLDKDREMEKEDETARASESLRYECRYCESHFCIDCDLFCHEVLHNCPGCLSRGDMAGEAEGEGQGEGDVVMGGS